MGPEGVVDTLPGPGRRGSESVSAFGEVEEAVLKIESSQDLVLAALRKCY